MNTEQSKQCVERTFVSTIESVVPMPNKLTTMVTVRIGDQCSTKFEVLGDGSEWTPGQRVDVILRAVHEPKAEEVQDAD